MLCRCGVHPRMFTLTFIKIFCYYFPEVFFYLNLNVKFLLTA